MLKMMGLGFLFDCKSKDGFSYLFFDYRSVPMKTPQCNESINLPFVYRI